MTGKAWLRSDSHGIPGSSRIHYQGCTLLGDPMNRFIGTLKHLTSLHALIVPKYYTPTLSHTYTQIHQIQEHTRHLPSHLHPYLLLHPHLYSDNPKPPTHLPTYTAICTSS